MYCMGVSKNWGPQEWTHKYYDPSYKDSENGPLIFGSTHIDTWILWVSLQAAQLILGRIGLKYTNNTFLHAQVFVCIRFIYVYTHTYIYIYVYVHMYT